MAVAVLRLSLHPSAAKTKRGTRFLKIEDIQKNTHLVREMPDYLSKVTVIVPRDQVSIISLGVEGDGEVDWSSPVKVDPREPIVFDYSVSVRVSAVREFEDVDAANKYVTAGKDLPARQPWVDHTPTTLAESLGVVEEGEGDPTTTSTTSTTPQPTSTTSTTPQPTTTTTTTQPPSGS